ncbi:flagellar type III secretion system protein FlhB [Phaeobacter marinintestinus]|uniref:flagellar type III secretion system protein FlhB n=1 Tax=Falsiphaeobacter marinintestinus TaxID=1492905 RepID=UPI0011B81315|nr:flagellar type III secretion system protein FlhB [Phaeobacter marinintestinus]
MSAGDNDTEKSFDPTPQKLQRAREKGEFARSTDLSVAASYAGLLLAFAGFGLSLVQDSGEILASFLDKPDRMTNLVFQGSGSAGIGAALWGVAQSLAAMMMVPAAAVLCSILAQRAFVVAPSKLALKSSRISVLSNAKQKFGRAGLFEFSKSFAKLLLYSVCLAWLLTIRLPLILSASAAPYQSGLSLMGRICLEFLFLVLLISTGIGVIDTIWQHQEHRRKNMMSRKDIQDEAKDSEGDPHMKQHRRQRGQEIAARQMMGDVPKADVVIVNPTHYSVALKWDRAPGSAPVCVAKGVDKIAARIRETAIEAGVPIHSDPPTARALFATVDVGEEVREDQYRAVAAAIRFADRMRQRAKGGI